MAYAFKQIEAHDPNNPGLVAPNASVTIFEPGDPTKTPLTLTTLAGDPLPNPVTVNGLGYGPAFMHATLSQVAWSGGGLTGTFESYEGMRDEAVAARTAAETAAATAGADAAAIADAAIGDATAEAEAAAASAAAAEAAAATSATAAANSAALVNAPADTAIAAAINGTGATKTALNATYTPATSVLQDLFGTIQASVRDVSILILSDSTGAMTSPEAESWAHQLPATLAARFPTHTISYRRWDTTGDTGYNAATTIAGTGARTIHLYNGSKAGEFLNYHLDDTRRNAQVVAVDPDVLLVSHGHNTNPNDVPDAFGHYGFRDLYLEYLEALRAYVPSAAVVLMSQNPQIGNTSSQRRADALRRMSVERGYGFIDATQAFLADGRPLTDLVSGDNIHPTVAGFTVWANTVAAAFKPVTTSQARLIAAPAFLESRRNLLINGDFANFNAAVPDNWAVNGGTLTVSKDTAVKDTAAYSVKIVKDVTGAPRFEQDLPLAEVKGKVITIAARIRVATGSTDTPAVLDFYDGTNIIGTAGVTKLLGQWRWTTVTLRVPTTATVARVRLRPNTTSGNVNTVINVEGIYATYGRIPALGLPTVAAASGTVLGPTLAVPPASVLTALPAAAWAAVDRVILARFHVPVTTQYRYLLWRCDTSSGNVQVGIVKLSGANRTSFTRVASSGVIPCPAAGDIRTDLGLTTLDAGDYALFLYADNTTFQTRQANSSGVPALRISGIMNSAGGVGTSGTFSWSNAYTSLVLEGDV